MAALFWQPSFGLFRVDRVVAGIAQRMAAAWAALGLCKVELLESGGSQGCVRPV